MTKRMSKILSILLILCMTLSAVPVYAAGSDDAALNEAQFPDPKFLACVKDFDLDRNGSLSLAERNEVTGLNLIFAGITDLTGIKHFQKLKTLDIFDNQIVSLDVTGNPELEVLNCGSNELTQLAVGTGLKRLYCADNKLTALNLGTCSMLEELDCARNQIETLDLRNHVALKKVYSNQNPLQSVNVTGCTGLERLRVYQSSLTSLDLTGCMNLLEVTCNATGIKSLDLAGRAKLEKLVADHAALESVNLSGCSGLEVLQVQNNHLSSLDLKDCANPDGLVLMADGNTYDGLYAGENACTEFPGTFDVTRVGQVNGGTFHVKGNNFVFDQGKDTATYEYDTGAGKTVSFCVKAGKVFENPFRDVVQDDYFYDSVLWAVKNHITAGSEPDLFEPESFCTRAQAVTFLWRTAGCPEPQQNSNAFVDVPADEYFVKSVQWAVENGITLGTGDNTFSPEDYCTRAQIVTFLWRSQGQPAATGSNPFADVPADEYYLQAALWAVENGITLGTGDDTFSPEDYCTRAQIVSFLYRNRNN